MGTVPRIGLWAGVVALLLLSPGTAGANAAATVRASVGDTAPVFSTADLDGNKVALDEILRAGKAVLLNFWGLRCGACIEEIGYLNRLYDEFSGRGVVFLGVNVDGVKADVVRQMMVKLENVPKYGVIAAPDFAIPDQYGLEAAPLSIVIAPGGTIVYRHENFQPGDEKALAEALGKALAAKP